MASSLSVTEIAEEIEFIMAGENLDGIDDEEIESSDLEEHVVEVTSSDYHSDNDLELPNNKNQVWVGQINGDNYTDENDVFWQTK